MLWVKSLHIIFVVSWFAGLFYLPRLFVYHTQVAADAKTEHDRFCIMERKLYAISTIAMVAAWIFGLWLLWLVPGFLSQGWLHAKLLLALALSGYHGWLKATLRRFAARSNTRSETFYRAINEVPAVILLIVVPLVVVKPF